MPSRKALFFTAGISDLKFVAKDSKALLELRKSGGPDYATIRQVHEALLELLDQDRICVLPFEQADVELPEDNRKIDIHFWKGDDPLAKPPVGSKLDEHPLLRTADRRLVLVADKFGTAWKSIKDDIRSFDAVVGFRTWRPERDDEPIATEKIIWDRLGRAIGPSHHELINYVEGETGWDAPFSRRAVNRIDDGVRACRAALPGDVEVVLAVSGGINQVKDILRASVGLHFGRARLILDREGGVSTKAQRTPHDSLLARRHVLDLVRDGAFIEAAGVARPFRDDMEAADQWVRPVCCVARLVDGNPVEAYAAGGHQEAAEKWEKKEAPPAFLKNIALTIFPGRDKPKLRCLLVGFRAEAALRSGRIIEAVNLTVSFFDAALRDAIEREFNGVFDVQDARFITLGRELSAGEQRDLTNNCPDGRYPCLSNAGPRHRFNSSTAHDAVWCKHLPGSLEHLRETLDREIEGRTIRRLRNQNTHNVLTDEQLAQAEAMIGQVDLWTGQGRARSLLQSPLISGVLSDLGHADGSNVFTRIVTGLEHALLGTKPA